MAALHDLEVKVADILYVYVIAPIRKKIWTVLDAEFGDNAKELYDLTSTGASFRAHLAKCMWELEYHSCDSGLNLGRLEHKLEYYSYMLCG